MMAIPDPDHSLLQGIGLAGSRACRVQVRGFHRFSKAQGLRAIHLSAFDSEQGLHSNRGLQGIGLAGSRACRVQTGAFQCHLSLKGSELAGYRAWRRTLCCCALRPAAQLRCVSRSCASSSAASHAAGPPPPAADAPPPTADAPPPAGSGAAAPLPAVLLLPPSYAIDQHSSLIRTKCARVGPRSYCVLTLQHHPCSGSMIQRPTPLLK